MAYGLMTYLHRYGCAMVRFPLLSSANNTCPEREKSDFGE